jgi:plastocyanin
MLAGAAALGAGTLSGPVTILGRDGRPRPSLKDAVAILEPLDGAIPVKAPAAPLVIRTRDKEFSPRVSLAVPGTEASFPNMDAILHNVFSLTPGNRFDTGHYLPGDAPRVKLRGPGLVKLYCNVHHQMNAFVWVVETPFAQLLEHRQGLNFTEVPPGAYRLRLWHPEAGERTWTVKIGNGDLRGAWTLEASLPALEPHKNKFGRDYPPAPDEVAY